MSSAAPTELSAAVIIQRIESGVLPREAMETIARGLLPLPQEELVPVLAFLALQTDASIAATAREALHDIPSRIVHGFAADEKATPSHLALLMLASDDAGILEALIRNRSVADDAVAELAGRTADAAVQEIVVINQARIIRAPQILDALLANPNLAPDPRRRALETREEFFDKKARAEAARVVDEDEADLELPDDAIADLLAKAAEQDPAEAQRPPEVGAAELKDERKQSVFTKILLMTVAEKIQLAYKGGKTERTILVRDHNRLICSAVMRNPRMTETEVESIAGMRGINEEVLRLIGMRRDWSSKYNIVIALARNPKTPVGVVLPIINRLTLRDLKYLKDDKGVSEVVRVAARKLFIQRSQKS